MGCNRERTPSHPAADRARAFLEALQYEDVERAYDHHVKSTEHGVYCRSESFQTVLERTRRRKTETDCEDARTLSPRRRASLEADAELLVQILRFTCEHPEGDCRDYAERVFKSQWPKSRLWRRLDGFELKRVEFHDDETAVYVDVIEQTGDEDSISHRSLTLEQYDGRWYVTDQPQRAERDSDR